MRGVAKCGDAMREYRDAMGGCSARIEGCNGGCNAGIEGCNGGCNVGCNAGDGI